jgi:hypothetical protein
MIQKTNAVYLEFHTYTSQNKNSQSFVHTTQRLDMCSASNTADVETIIQLVPNLWRVSLVMEAMAAVIPVNE